MHRFILHNGQLIGNDAHTASVGQVGLLNGWGVFSTIRVLDGVLFAWEKHWERMCRDAVLMRVPMPAAAEDLKQPLERLIEANGAENATLRVAVVRNKGGAFQAPHLEREFDVVAYTVDLQDWGTAAKLGVQMQGRHAASPMAGVKVTSWSQNLTFLEMAKAKGYDEVVLLNERGEVSECTSANLFVVKGVSVQTPPMTSGCLPGVTRRLLLEEVKVPGVHVEEKTLRLDDLYEADSVFMTSTTRELLRVEAVEGKKTGVADDVRERLHGEFRRSMAQYAAVERQRRARRVPTRSH
ncbi:MAG: aminotransferase class IV [Acidobacteriota bacterium]